MQVLLEFDVLHENVVALVSDSAAYMTACVNLLKSLGLSNLIHVQCWAHKLDKVVKVFADKFNRLNNCVIKAKKFFKNTRKRKHRYQKYLKDKLKNEKKPTWHDYFFSYFASEYYLLDGEGSKFSCSQSS